MRQIVLGKTGIATPQNAFGALPIQRCDDETAVRILRKAYEGGMTFFDTARAYSDSEKKIGLAFSDVRKSIFIATKTGAKDTEEMKRHIETSLKNLRTDYIDLYQFHLAPRCFAPGDGSGMYELMEEFKRQGMIRNIGITCHRIGVAEECIESGLYATMQFPFSYLSGERERKLTAMCREKEMGFIAMKALAGGLIDNFKAAYAFIAQFDNVLPIWGIQSESELEQWLSCMEKPPAMDEEVKSVIETDRKELNGDFCRGCGYCMPCPEDITINQCARMSLMIRRSPAADFLGEKWQKEMKKIENCAGCGLCMARCPFELEVPKLLKKNYEDYKRVLAGEISVVSQNKSV